MLRTFTPRVRNAVVVLTGSATTSLLLAGILAMVCGCSSSDANSDAAHSEARQAQRPGDAGIVPKRPIPEEYVPVTADGTPLEFGEKSYADGTPTHYADGSPTYMPDGQPIDYRARNIMRTLDELPTVFLREPTMEPVRLVGIVSNPRRDPETGEICWLAYECTNPKCSGLSNKGAANLFAIQSADVTTSDNGSLVAARGPAEIDEEGRQINHSRRSATERCPLCGTRDVRFYEPDDISKMRQELLRQLHRINSEHEAGSRF